MPVPGAISGSPASLWRITSRAQVRDSLPRERSGRGSANRSSRQGSRTHPRTYINAPGGGARSSVAVGEWLAFKVGGCAFI